MSLNTEEYDENIDLDDVESEIPDEADDFDHNAPENEHLAHIPDGIDMDEDEIDMIPDDEGDFKELLARLEDIGSEDSEEEDDSEDDLDDDL
jgi:hypothetical protein